jgi:DNA-binding MarR family transcriptional regulator
MSERSDVVRALGNAVRLLRGRLDAELQQHGLRLGQFNILRLLWERDGLTPGQLADGLAVEMPTVTRTVQRMVRDALVRRQAHPNDARSVRIFLTSRGHAVREELSGLLDRFTERVLHGLGEAERTALVELLETIAANASADEVR